MLLYLLSTNKIMKELYCNNCGKSGHLYSQCKIPITSIGFIVFRIFNNKLQYLMIRRKDTLGFIDFMRGKYSIYNRQYILNMLNQMTVEEKNVLLLHDFDSLWKKIWGNEKLSCQYKSEEVSSSEKFNLLKSGIYINGKREYSLEDLIYESNKISNWSEAEWGFPKGRRNFQEKDFECALREFSEETGITDNKLINIQNILPFEEIFTGSNYKSYKHKYYVAFNKNNNIGVDNFQKTEVSNMDWFDYSVCQTLIRPYNLEKKKILTKVNKTLQMYKLFYC